jgi:hypothetical protein
MVASQAERDQVIPDRCLHVLMPICGYHHILLTVFFRDLAHRCGLAASGQAALPELAPDLDDECADIVVLCGGHEYQPPCVTIVPRR